LFGRFLLPSPQRAEWSISEKCFGALRRWPRNNIPRIGGVLIGQGRDAADIPITQTFGPNTLVSFKVWTRELL
jgi:hypothetical protein